MCMFRNSAAPWDLSKISNLKLRKPAGDGAGCLTGFPLRAVSVSAQGACWDSVMTLGPTLVYMTQPSCWSWLLRWSHFQLHRGYSLPCWQMLAVGLRRRPSATPIITPASRVASLGSVANLRVSGSVCELPVGRGAPGDHGGAWKLSTIPIEPMRHSHSRLTTLYKGVRFDTQQL